MTYVDDNRQLTLEEDKEKRLVSLYDEYYSKVARYAYVRIGDKTESEDIASEVFLKALDSIKTYEERGLPMQAWLFRIAHNLVVDHLRRVSQRTIVRIDKVEIKDETDPVAKAETNIEMTRVNEAMESLTEEQREVIRLRFFGGLTSAEAAGVLKKSDGAVREMQRAALEKLRNLLNENRPGMGANGRLF
jgi:RNA polymerase sigma-70 factor (ECF subfamily)